MKKGVKIFLIVAAVILVAGGIGFYFYYSHMQSAKVHYSSVILKRGNITYGITATGNLNDSLVINVGTQVSGIISHVAGVIDSATYNGDGIPAANAHLYGIGIASGPDGLIYIADYFNNRIRAIDKNGIIHTIAGNGIEATTGDGGLADTAEIDNPDQVIFDLCGNLYFAQTNNPRVRKIQYPHCGFLSISEPQPIATEISVYPNPVINELNIESTLNFINYQVVNLVGSVFLKGDLQQGKNTISFTGLPPGIYLLKVLNKEGLSEVRKIVKE